MKVQPNPIVQFFSGYLSRIVYCSYKRRDGLMSAREYSYPTSFTDHQVSFGNMCHAVNTTWPNADSNFQDDMQTYADAWNETQQPGHLEMRDLSDFNTFLMGCYAAAEETGFDLTTLTVDNFGGEAGDLLGTESPTVGNLITVAGMPACGLDLSTLNSPIVSV